MLASIPSPGSAEGDRGHFASIGPGAGPAGTGDAAGAPAWARAGAADAIAAAVDRIRARFGDGAIRPGRIALETR